MTSSSTGTPESRNDSMMRAGAERRGLEQGAVDVLGTGGERDAEDQSGQLMVDENRAVSAVPVQRNQAVLTDGLLSGELGEQLVDGDAPLGGGALVAVRDRRGRRTS